eukprot:2277097-Rhodomonas_salina.2
MSDTLIAACGKSNLATVRRLSSVAGVGTSVGTSRYPKSGPFGIQNPSWGAAGAGCSQRQYRTRRSNARRWIAALTTAADLGCDGMDPMQTHPSSGGTSEEADADSFGVGCASLVGGGRCAWMRAMTSGAHVGLSGERNIMHAPGTAREPRSVQQLA